MTTNPADGDPFARRPEPTLEEIIRAKRPHPLRSVEELMAHDVFESDDEVDEFIAFYREQRQASLG
jgi:hypothetical protein